MQQRHVHCLARRARFVLDHWGVFSPFLEPHNRPRDGPLARRLLALEQAQAHALLGILDIAFDGLGFPLLFLEAQVREGGDDGRQEKHHGDQWRQRRVAVLSGG